MKMTELSFEDDQPPIDGYAPGGFRVQGLFREGPLLLTPSRIGEWPVTSVESAGEDAARALLAELGDAVDLIVLGTGAAMTAPQAGFRRLIDAQGLGLEFMATPTACRTYNVLLSEDRRVAAALIPV